MLARPARPVKEVLLAYGLTAIRNARVVARRFAAHLR
jgi:hypothetical protein